MPGIVSRETFFIIYAFLKHVGLNVLRILFNVDLRKKIYALAQDLAQALVQALTLKVPTEVTPAVPLEVPIEVPLEVPP